MSDGPFGCSDQPPFIFGPTDVTGVIDVGTQTGEVEGSTRTGPPLASKGRGELSTAAFMDQTL